HAAPQRRPSRHVRRLSEHRSAVFRAVSTSRAWYSTCFLERNFVLFAPCEETHYLPQHLPVHREAGRSVSHLACTQSHHKVLSQVLQSDVCAVWRPSNALARLPTSCA